MEYLSQRRNIFKKDGIFSTHRWNILNRLEYLSHRDGISSVRLEYLPQRRNILKKVGIS
jgi:hypothetical protein